MAPLWAQLGYGGIMNTTKRILGVGLAVVLLAGGASMTAVAPVQAEPPTAKQDSKSGEASEKGEKKDIKQGDKPAAPAGDEKSPNGKGEPPDRDETGPGGAKK